MMLDTGKSREACIVRILEVVLAVVVSKPPAGVKMLVYALPSDCMRTGQPVARHASGSLGAVLSHFAARAEDDEHAPYWTEVLSQTQAHIVCLARAFIANPEAGSERCESPR